VETVGCVCKLQHKASFISVDILNNKRRQGQGKAAAGTWRVEIEKEKKGDKKENKIKNTVA
jgi:hypothetical protein